MQVAHECRNRARMGSKRQLVFQCIPSERVWAVQVWQPQPQLHPWHAHHVHTHTMACGSGHNAL